MAKKSPFPTQTALLWPWQWPQHLGKPDLPESFAPGQLHPSWNQGIPRGMVYYCLTNKKNKWWVNTPVLVVYRRLEINPDIDIDTLIYL